MNHIYNPKNTFIKNLKQLQHIVIKALNKTGDSANREIVNRGRRRAQENKKKVNISQT